MITLKDLDRFGRDIQRKFPTVNGGGCAVVAYELAKQLGKLWPVRVIVFDDETYTSIPIAREHLNSPAIADEWNKNGVNFGHIVTEFDLEGQSYIIHAGGLMRSSVIDLLYGCYWRVEGSLSLDEIKMLATTTAGWSKDFDRADIPRIKRKISRFFARRLKHNRPS